MRHMLHNLGFGAKYAAAVDKVLKVHIADIGENNVIGTCNCAQSVHFAEVADAHFNNRKLVMRFETENVCGSPYSLLKLPSVLRTLNFVQAHRKASAACLFFRRCRQRR